MRARLALLMAAPALLAAGSLLAACGGSTSSPSHAAEERGAETRFLDYAKCLREHGVNAEAVSHGPGGGQGLKIGPGKTGASPGFMQAAEKACARYRPPPQTGSPSPQQKVEFEEAAQKFAKCMREHGIEVRAGSSGIQISAGPGAHLDPESPTLKRAQSACQKLLPGGGPGAS
jgi:hypothetical protein